MTEEPQPAERIFFHDDARLPTRADRVQVVLPDGTTIETFVEESRIIDGEVRISMVPVDAVVTEAEAIIREHA